MTVSVSMLFIFLTIWSGIYLFPKMMKNKPKVIRPVKNTKVKYILEWKFSLFYRFFPCSGNQTFIGRNCSLQNCYVTFNRLYFLERIVEFDAIIFNGPHFLSADHIPHERSPSQLYIFATPEPSAYFPTSENEFQDFYNWTWTYLLDSDISFTYLTIRDKQGNIIGPKKDMNWKKSDEIRNTSLDDSVVTKLEKKKKAAACIISSCKSSSKRVEVIESLQFELTKYDLRLDVYGKCGELDCDYNKNEECWKMIESDYYFYLSFENSFGEDYVSEKLLNPLKHYTVPVVYGGANYTRFLPDGSYLNARKLGVEELARQINDLIHDKEMYYQYFKWHNFYSYHRPDERPDSDHFCQLCEMLNNQELVRKKRVYENFYKWWNRHEYFI